MRKVIFLVGLILFLNASSVYGQKNTEMQNANEQSQESKTFDEPLEKRTEKAISGMEKYGEEIQKEIEPIKDKEEKYKTFFSRLHNYLSQYIKGNSIKELLALEAKILKKEVGPETIYGWFWGSVHNTVLNLAGYNPDVDMPIADKILEIIQDESVDDYVRSKYVISVEWSFTKLHNKQIKVDEKIKEKVYPVLIKVIENTDNDSRLRAEAAGALASIGRRNEKIEEYILKLLDDKDDLVKRRTIGRCSFNDENIKKLITMLKNRDQYSENVITEVRMKLRRVPDKSSAAIPYLLDMLNDTNDKEEVKRITFDLQKYDNLSVMEPIIRKFKELKLEQPHEDYYYLKNKLLLEYLPQASKEDRLLIIKLIWATAHQIGGNIEVPHHYDKAIKVLRDELSNANKDVRLFVINTYGRMINAIKHESLNSVEKDRERLLKEIEVILNEHKKQETDEFLLSVTEQTLEEIKKSKNEKTIPTTN